MEDLDEGKVGCGIFCRPSKSLWHILLAKLDYYGICGVANDWFRSYLSDRRQFVSINEFNSNHAMLKNMVKLNEDMVKLNETTIKKQTQHELEWRVWHSQSWKVLENLS